MSLFAQLAAYESLAVTALLWGVVGVSIMAPFRLVHAVYHNSKLSGKYHFRTRYHLEKATYQHEIKVYGFIIISVSVLLIGFIIASHSAAVSSVMDSFTWELLKLIESIFK